MFPPACKVIRGELFVLRTKSKLSAFPTELAAPKLLPPFTKTAPAPVTGRSATPRARKVGAPTAPFGDAKILFADSDPYVICEFAIAIVVHARLSVTEVYVSVCPAVQLVADDAPVTVERRSAIETKFGVQFVPS